MCWRCSNIFPLDDFFLITTHDSSSFFSQHSGSKLGKTFEVDKTMPSSSHICGDKNTIHNWS